MINRLEPIIAQKKLEVAQLVQLINAQPEHDIAQFYARKKRRQTKSLKKALSTRLLSIIAEIKRKSPAKGALADIENPLALAKTYVEGGASALSILTDEKFFAGSAQDLQTIAQADFVSHTPLLRKDFIIDPLQIAEAAYLGADAILCIVAVLGEKTKEYVAFAEALGLESLVEIHDRSEIETALQSGAKIIGINNRNLSTFEVNTEQAIQIKSELPDDMITVAESGIFDPQLAHRYHDAGFDAVLIGEALVTSLDPKSFIYACQHETTAH